MSFHFTLPQPFIHLGWPREKLILLVFCCLTSFSGVAQYAAPAVNDSDFVNSKERWNAAQRGAAQRNTQQTATRWTQTTLYKTTAAPILLITGGLLTFHDNKIFDKYDVRHARQQLIPDFRTHADDYLQFAPIGVVYGLDLLGVKAKHRFMDRSFRLATAELFSVALVFPIKKYTHIERPDGSDFMSFPSGHTAQAFVAATFMHKELGYLSPWYSIGAYTTATAVGVLRIMNNRHWLSDVLVGAGIGILSTNVAYLIFPEEHNRNRKGKASGLIIIPAYQEGNIGFHMLLTLH